MNVHYGDRWHRRQGCRRKVMHKTPELANAAGLKAMAERPKPQLYVMRCTFCGYWHLTKNHGYGKHAIVKEPAQKRKKATA